MSYTNETTHYSIPLPLGSDKTTPMDYNQSAQEVDTVLFEAKTDSASALQKANQLQQDLATTNDNVTAVTGRVTTLEGTVTTQGQAILQNTQDIADVRADALDMIVAKDEGTAQVAIVAVVVGEYFRYNDVLYIATQNIAVGDTIVPNTNCRATNVGTELTQLNTSLANSGKATYIKSFTTLNQTEDDSILNGYTRVAFVLRSTDYRPLEIQDVNIDLFRQLNRCDIVIYQDSTYNAAIEITYVGNTLKLNSLNINGWSFIDIAIFGIK